MLKLSVITINLNNYSGLLKTIESVREQSFKDYEFIIIDGGSNDGSVELIKKNSDIITYWVSEPDHGIYNAMNKGILKATGEYCQFLNSGDYLSEKNILEKVFSCAESPDIMVGNTFMVYPDRIEKQESLISKKKNAVSLYDILTESICHQSVFIKRYLFDKYGLYDEKYKVISDWKFFAQTIGLAGVSVGYIDEYIVYFDMSGISSIEELHWSEYDKVYAEVVPRSISYDMEELKVLRFIKYYGVFRKMYELLNKLVWLYQDAVVWRRRILNKLFH
jgi:Predicted glycosyltransferases